MYKDGARPCDEAEGSRAQRAEPEAEELLSLIPIPNPLMREWLGAAREVNVYGFAARVRGARSMLL